MKYLRKITMPKEQQNQVGKEGLWRRVMVQKENKRKISWKRVLQHAKRGVRGEYPPF
jgi:ribonuclease HI